MEIIVEYSKSCQLLQKIGLSQLINATGTTLILTAFALCTLFSCSEESMIDDNPTIDPPMIDEKISAGIYGRVIDERLIPVIGAKVTIRSVANPIQILTDIEGYFRLDKVENEGASAFLSVSSSNKFKAFKRFSLLPDRYNYTEIMLLDKEISGSFNSLEGGTISLDHGAQVTFEKEAVERQSGGMFSGAVNVAMTWINPLATDLSLRMIGDLSGMGKDGQVHSLSTYGMMTVEIFDRLGNELKIRDKGAIISFPVPQAMMNHAENSIPFWSYDELNGTWIEEGEARLEDQAYVAEVSHFSSFNVDVKTDPIEITGEVIWETSNGQVAGSYQQIYLVRNGNGTVGGWLCDDGNFRFYNFPKDEDFELRILDKCGEIKYSNNYGPFFENTDLGTIRISTNEVIIKVTGNAIDCEGLPVSNGQLSVRQKERKSVFPINKEGHFEFSLDLCDDIASIMTITDKESLKTVSVELDDQFDHSFLSDISVCEDPNDYVHFVIGDDYPVLFGPNILFRAYDAQDLYGNPRYITDIWYDLKSPLQKAGFDLHLFTPEQSLTTEIAALDFTYYDQRINVYRDSNFEVIITRYDSLPGGSFEGNFKGDVQVYLRGLDSSYVSTVTGEFKVPTQ